MLSQNEEKFARLLLTAKSEKVAYRDAFPDAAKLTDAALAKRIWKLECNHEFVERVKELRDRAASMQTWQLREAMRELIDIATADPNEIIQYRHVCCRYCYGEGHKRMWTWGEYAVELGTALKAGEEPPEHTGPNRGGVGYNTTLPPVADCPECYGQGVGEVWIEDTRNLRGKAAKLYAGVELTKHGVKVLMRDQDAALKNYLAAAGAFLPKGPEDKGNLTPEQFLRELGMQLPN